MEKNSSYSSLLKQWFNSVYRILLPVGFMLVLLAAGIGITTDFFDKSSSAENPATDVSLKVRNASIVMRVGETIRFPGNEYRFTAGSASFNFLACENVCVICENQQEAQKFGPDSKTLACKSCYNCKLFSPYYSVETPGEKIIPAPGSGSSGYASFSNAILDNTSTAGGGPFAFEDGTIELEAPETAGFTINLGSPSVDAVCESDNNFFTCDDFALGAGEKALFPFTITATEVGSWTATLRISTELYDPIPEDNEISVTITVIPTISVVTQSYTDENGNGMYDDFETGLNGVNIDFLAEDGSILTTLTSTEIDLDEDGEIDAHNEQGLIQIDGVPEGSFKFQADIPEGLEQTYPFENGLHTITYDGTTEQDSIYEFGFTQIPVPTTTVTAQKFADENANGTFDDNESGLNGVNIELKDEEGNVIQSSASGDIDINEDGEIDPHSERGLVRFSGIEPGTYALDEVSPEGFEQTFPANGQPHTITYDGTTAVETVFRFGNWEPLFKLCGLKFIDLNGNGIQEEGDVGVSGVTIELLDENGTLIKTTKSNLVEDLNEDGEINPMTEFGRFCFENLPRGTYVLREQIGSNWIQTFPEGGTHEVELATGSQPRILFGNMPDPETTIPPPDTTDTPDLFFADYGDLPDPRADVIPSSCPGASCYPTIKTSAGASHLLGGDVWLGYTVDWESDGLPTNTADGDDQDFFRDEDGLLSLEVQSDNSIRFEIIATVVAPLEMAYLDAWLDISDDGFLSPSEKIFASQPVFNGVNVLITALGLDVADLPGFMRFRISSVGGLPPTGLAADGEVEDYLLAGVDFGDAPGFINPERPDFPGGYPTSLAQDGARHPVFSLVRLGSYIDPEGQAGGGTEVTGSFDAMEDDQNRQQDDEDGLHFTEGATITSTSDIDEIIEIVREDTVLFLPLPSVEGYLDAWVDWNRDGDWEDEREQIFQSEDIDVAMLEEDALSIFVPEDAELGFTYARFRFSRKGGLSFTGAAPDGEVEDYLFKIKEDDNPTSIEEGKEIPESFYLHPNYPNPFNPTTQIRYEIPNATFVHLAIYDVLGRKVKTLVHSNKQPGVYFATWDGSSDAGTPVGSGVYFSRIEAGEFIKSQKMTLIK